MCHNYGQCLNLHLLTYMTKVRGMDQWIDAGSNLGSAAKRSAISLEVAGSGLEAAIFSFPSCHVYIVL